MAIQSCDLLVVGAGAGGIGAAASAAVHGLQVILLERSCEVGGTAGSGGVSHWEAGVGGTGVPIDIYRKLRTMGPKAVAICGMGRHCCANDPALREFPGGEHRICPDRKYADTLRRYGAADATGYPYEFYRKTCFGVCFTPEAYAAACGALLSERGVEVRTNVTVTGVEMDGGVVRGVRTAQGDILRALCTVDASGTAAVAGPAGCRLRSGREGRDVFGETNAPERSDGVLNGVTQMFRVAPRSHASVDPLPSDTPAGCWWSSRFPAFSTVELPDGTWSLNMLPTMSGAEALALGERAQAECRRRALAAWHDVQSRYPEFQRFTLHSFAPALGVRDAPRVVCRHTLTQPEMEEGLTGPVARDRIAIADHVMDIHGEGHIARSRLAGPYGIPFACLIAADREGLLIAGRGAGFSAIAASSVRLTRTVMQLGQAAGTAAALAARRGIRVADLPVAGLQAQLRADGVQLDAGLTGEAARRVATADEC